MAGITETFATNVDGAGTNLQWQRFVPSSGGPTWPVGLVLSGGRYKMFDTPTAIAQDLANAGFLAIYPQYRLAPPHSNMPAQVDPPSDGRPTQQTDDVRLAIRTARAHTQSTGKVCAVGFSSGGGHAVWWAVNGSNNDDRPEATVSCSGIHDLDNSDILSQNNARPDIENYLNHTVGEGATFVTAAKAASSYWSTPPSTPGPIALINSNNEIIPSSIYSTMVTKLTTAGGTLENFLRTGTEHASSYWNLGYGGSFGSVKLYTIDFFQRMLAITPPVVVSPATIVFSRR